MGWELYEKVGHRQHEKYLVDGNGGDKIAPDSVMGPHWNHSSIENWLDSYEVHYADTDHILRDSLVQVIGKLVNSFNISILKNSYFFGILKLLSWTLSKSSIILFVFFYSVRLF